MTQTLADARRFLSENNWRTILARIHARDTHPIIQFLKYGICGVGALLVHQLICALVATWFFPVLGADLGRDTRAWNLFYCNAIAFIFGNSFAYWSNVRWVFMPGRHHQILEFIYFTLIGLAAFAAGILAGPYMIHLFDLHPLIAQLLLIIVSVLVNFICRKLFVFQH
ncbi:MAG: GtrA family protein [Verrucomicrobiaceae bacterium]|nr:GtrA family protein [Verrucomicrobiaceae bacterium]